MGVSEMGFVPLLGLRNIPRGGTTIKFFADADTIQWTTFLRNFSHTNPQKQENASKSFKCQRVYVHPMYIIDLELHRPKFRPVLTKKNHANEKS